MVDCFLSIMAFLRAGGTGLKTSAFGEEAPASGGTAFERAKAVGKRARALPATHSLFVSFKHKVHSLCKENFSGFRFGVRLLPLSRCCGGVTKKEATKSLSKPDGRAAAGARSKSNRKRQQKMAGSFLAQRVQLDKLEMNNGGVKGHRPLRSLGASKGIFSFGKRISLLGSAA